MSVEILQHRILETSALLGRDRRERTWMRGAVCLLLAGAGLALVDLAFPLPTPARGAAGIAWLGGWLVAAACGVLTGMRLRRRPAEFFAAWLERTIVLSSPAAHDRAVRPGLPTGRQMQASRTHHNEAARLEGAPASQPRRRADGNTLVNAVQFSRRLAAGQAGTVSVPLMRAEIDRGRQAADSLSPEAVRDPRAIRRDAAVLAFVLTAIAATAGLWPDAWTAVLPRFADPGGDHPPYCPTRFAVRYETRNPDGRVDYGESVMVVVEMSGRELPDGAHLVLYATPPLRESARVPLFRRNAAQWVARIDNVREELRFRVCVPHGFSRMQRLVPDLAPRIRGVVVRYAPPPEAGRPPYERTLGKEGIREVRGTTVTLTVASNRPLRGGEASLTDTTEPTSAGMGGTPRVPQSLLACTPRDTDSVQVTFPLLNTGRVTASVIGIDGLRSRDTVEADLRPIDLPSTAVRIAPTLPASTPAEPPDAAPTSTGGRTPAPASTRTRRTARPTSSGANEIHTQADDGASTGGRTPAPANTRTRRTAHPTSSDASEIHAQADDGTAIAAPGDRTAGPPTATANRTTGGTPGLLAPAPGANVGTETLSPDVAVPIDVGPIGGERIPPRYRELTEAYFRRLAEDNR